MWIRLNQILNAQNESLTYWKQCKVISMKGFFRTSAVHRDASHKKTKQAELMVPLLINSNFRSNAYERQQGIKKSYDESDLSWSICQSLCRVQVLLMEHREGHRYFSPSLSHQTTRKSTMRVGAVSWLVWLQLYYQFFLPVDFPVVRFCPIGFLISKFQ